MKKQILIFGALVLAGTVQTAYSITNKQADSFTKKVTQQAKDILKKVETLLEKETGGKLSNKQKTQLLLMIQHPGAEDTGKTQQQISADFKPYTTEITSQCCCCSECNTELGECLNECDMSCQKGAEKNDESTSEVAPKLNNQKKDECPAGTINVGSSKTPNCVANPGDCAYGELC